MPDDDFTEPPFPNGHVATATPIKPPIAIIAVVAIVTTVITIFPVAAVRSYAQVQLRQRGVGLRTNGRVCPSWKAVRDAAAATTSAILLMCLLLLLYFEINDLLSELFLRVLRSGVCRPMTREPGVEANTPGTRIWVRRFRDV
jgi:hypothetical protein